MNPVALILSLAALLLLSCGAAAFAAMVKGGSLLRRLRGARINPTDTLLKSPLVPPISVLVAPEGDPQEGCAFVRRLLSLHYSRHEVVVVLDAPRDADLAVWVQEFHLGLSGRRSSAALPGVPIVGIYESFDPIRIVLVHQERGSSEPALNNALNVAAFPVIGLVDPDSEFAPTLLLRLIQPMLEQPDSTMAVCGIGPAPPGHGWVQRVAGLEFLRLYLARCAGFAASGSIVPVPGSAVILRRDALIAGGGFRVTTLKLLLHLQGLARREKRPFEVAFMPDPVAYLRPPNTMAALRRAILRDQMEIRRAVVAAGRIAGGIGAARRALPALLVARLVRPLVETAAYLLTLIAWLAGWIDGALAIAVLLTGVGTGILLSTAAVVLWDISKPEGTDPKLLIGLFATAIPENLGYRQLRNLWLIAGFFSRPPRPAPMARKPQASAAVAG